MSTRPEGPIKESLMRWGGILTVVILTGICALSLLLDYQSATASEMLPISIQANKMADYSVDEVSALNPAVNIEIIEAAIKDEGPTNVAARVENVRANLQTLVPTVTPTAVSTDTPMPSNEQPDFSQATATNPPPATATPRPSKTSTPNKTTPPTENAATATKTGTAGPSASPTKKNEKTATHTLPATPTATVKPTQTATQSPPTATDTATQSPPTATNTATKTATPVPPTATMTPTSACTRPNLITGFVDYTYPLDGAVDVPRDVVVVIQFNQPMYEGDLFRNIRVSGTNVHYVMHYDAGTYQVKIYFTEWLKPGAKVLVEVKRNAKNMCMWRQITEVEFKFTITKK
jgi:hypothetical protein